MSSGEAEYYAVVKAAAETLGMQALAFDLGWTFGVRLFVDSTAARAIASRLGLGKVRHLEVRYLWLQQVVASGRLKVCKIKGTDNPADLLTKPLTQARVAELLDRVNIRVQCVAVDARASGEGGCRPSRTLSMHDTLPVWLKLKR